MSITNLAEGYRVSSESFLELVATLNESDLDRSDNEGWSPRQVIHHLADSEAQSYARLRRLIAEPGTLIQGYDEGLWASNVTLNYTNRDIASAIAVFKAVRQSSFELLLTLTEDQLSNQCTHTESGPYTVRDWLSTYTRHPLDHAEQIRKQLRN